MAYLKFLSEKGRIRIRIALWTSDAGIARRDGIYKGVSLKTGKRFLLQ